MDLFPVEIWTKIVKYINNYRNIYLVSKLFRDIYISVISSSECRIRVKYHLSDDLFLERLFLNKNSHKRSITVKNKKWKLKRSCLEILFKKQINCNADYFKNIIEKFIPDCLFEKLLRIATLHNRVDIIVLLIMKKKDIDLQYSFSIAYDHSYDTIVRMFYNYKVSKDTYSLYSEFSDLQRKQFEDVFIYNKTQDIDVKLFKHHKRLLVNCSLVSNNINILRKLNLTYDNNDKYIFLQDVISWKTSASQDMNLWNKKKLSTFLYVFPNPEARIQKEYPHNIIYFILYYEEIDLLNYIVKIFGLCTIKEIVIKAILNSNIKLFIKIRQNFPDFEEVFCSTFSFIMLFDLFIFNKPCTQIFSSDEQLLILDSINNLIDVDLLPDFVVYLKKLIYQ